MKIKSLIILAAIYAMISPVLLPAQEMKPTTVAGFINTGDAKNDSVNIQITKSLIAFLSKYSKRITPFESVEAQAKSGYWKLKKPDSAAAIAVSFKFGSQQVITGDYYVNDEKETIEINVYDYNTATGELLLKRNYKGSAGVDLFDTIDKMIKDVSGLLIAKKEDTGTLKIGIEPQGKIYKLFINGEFQKEISKTIPYEGKFTAGDSVKVSLKMADTGKEVFQKYYAIEKDRTVELNYVPVGTVIVKIGESDGDVFMNGKMVGVVDKNGDFSIPNVPTDVKVEVLVKNNGRIVGQETVIQKEGDIKVVLLGKAKEFSRPFAFPVEFGMTDLFKGSYVAVGFDWTFWQGLHAYVTGGSLLYSEPKIGFGIVPLATLGVGYRWKLFQNFQAGVNLSASVQFFSTQVLLNPMITGEAQYWMFYISAGARYSLGSGGIYPVFSAGIKI